MLNKKRTTVKKSVTKVLMTTCIMLSTVTVSNIHNVYASEAFKIESGYEATDGEYVISNSDTKEIDAASLKYLSAEQLRLARNEIYARHGRLFNDPNLQEYFNSRSWYNGYISPENFDENCLSKIESKNVSKIVKAEKNLSASSEYIISDSNSVYLTEKDLSHLTLEQLRLARNEIYARHGRLFKDSSLQNYFNSCSWYSGTIAADDFSESVFNSYEEKNVLLICKVEKNRKGNSGTNADNGALTFVDFLGSYRCANNGGLSFYKSESSPTGYGIATFIYSTWFEDTACETEGVRCVYPTNVISYDIDGNTLTLTYGYDSPEGNMTCVLDENHGLTVSENGREGIY